MEQKTTIIKENAKENVKENAIKTHFSRTVDDYDIVADKVVMKNDELHEIIVNAVPFERNQQLRILDLGSGTAFGMLLILRRFPYATIFGIDFSSKMIESARKNLVAYLEHVKLLEDDFTTAVFEKDFNIIMSPVTIHNISHKQKKLLFKKIYDSLSENGVFINGDFIEAEIAELNIQYQAIYRKFLESNLTGEELQVWLKHAFVDDKPMKLSEQFELLKDCGFKEISLLWQFNNEAVYIARK